MCDRHVKHRLYKCLNSNNIDLFNGNVLCKWQTISKSFDFYSHYALQLKRKVFLACVTHICVYIIFGEKRIIAYIYATLFFCKAEGAFTLGIVLQV